MRVAHQLALVLGLLLVLSAPALAQQPSHKPGGYHSPEIQKDQSWSHVFNATGVSHYHCHPHPFMLGTVEVKEGASTAPMAVEIRGFKFIPDSIVVGVGTNVTWTNRDPSFHTIDESAEGPTPESGGGAKSAALPVGVVVLIAAAVVMKKTRQTS